MKLTDKTVGILGGIAILMLVFTIVMYSGDKKIATTFVKGTPLIQGIPPENVAKIIVKKDSDTLTLILDAKKKFTVVEKAGYPAQVDKINELLLKFFKIRCAAKVTSNKENYKDLGLTEDKPEKGSLELIDDDGKTLVKVLVGKSVENGSGEHVRIAGKDDVYATEESLWFYATATSYMETKLLDVSKDDTESVQVSVGSDNYTITKDKDKKTKLSPIPAGKKAKDSDVDSVFTALSYMNFSDVMKDDGSLKWDAKYTCKLKLTTYFLELAKKGDKHYVRLRAEGPPASLIQKCSRIKKDDPKEKLEEKEKVFKANDAAHEFNAKHGGWAYEISDWKAKNLRKALKDLVEDIPKEKKDDKKEPEKVSASHILIAYKGAERSKATRTKDEAKALAKKVLKRVKEDKEDFAKVAKEMSDGPSKTEGGDLGSFGKGAMAKAFEEAAWKLKVGEISGLVETPFGFHIIKRTK